MGNAWLLAVLLGATGLAGCGGLAGSSCDGFCMTPPADPSGAYAFRADVAADEYLWDFGDHTTASGHDVMHSFPFRDGKVNVRLTAKSADGARAFQQPITLGTGTNKAPTFLLEAQTDWAAVGESVTFSAAGSTDPEHDPLLFSWSCQRVGEAIRLAEHYDNARPPPITPSAGSIASGRANHTLPEATKSYSGDLCDSLGHIGDHALSADAQTVKGTFQRPGKYMVFLEAADATHPTVSGSFSLVVTPASERPAARYAFPFAGTLTAGTQSATGADPPLQTGCNKLPEKPRCDIFLGNFSLPLGASSSWINLTYDRGTAGQPPVAGTPGEAAAYEVTWELLRSGFVIASGGPAQDTTFLPGSATPFSGNFTARVTLRQGANVAFTWSMESHIEADPYKLYY
ncbi:MAG: PKD domain-containing protein [bacterium]